VAVADSNSPEAIHALDSVLKKKGETQGKRPHLGFGRTDPISPRLSDRDVGKSSTPSVSHARKDRGKEGKSCR